jgi:ubiquinone/menaquinone biosynthesis C-methylase UbiE
MNRSVDWKQVWEEKSGGNVSDFQLDRGISPRDQEIERLSQEELVNFIKPSEFEVLLDVGCGTGVNILRLHSQVKNIIGFDYALGALQRCQKRIQEQKIGNARVCLASAVTIPLSGCTVDKVLCLSVLQYLNDQEFREALKEFVRVLTPGGTIILHVKNLSSVYWSTLLVAKKLKTLLGLATRVEYFRTFRWYLNELSLVGLTVVDYNSLNLLYLEGMPKRLLSFLQKLELRNHKQLFRVPFIRRHGAELKIKARLPGRHLECQGSDGAPHSAGV